MKTLLGSRANERSVPAVLAAMLALVMAIPQVALAASFTILLDFQVIRAPQGTRVFLTAVNTPAEFVGQVCDVTASPINNQSVHPDNHLEVVSATTVLLPDVEGAPNKVTTSTGPIELGPTIEVWLIMGPDRVYSGDFNLRFDCEPPATTTTLPEETTTTTTVPEETTTTVPEETTTTVPEETTTTTVPEETTTTVPPEVEETTTTTAPPEVSSTTIGTTPETLPFTGGENRDLALLAVAALLAGAGLVALSARSEGA